MLRIALTTAFIFVLLSGSLLRLSKVLEFALNYDFVVAELCEQRDAVQNTCNGSCHLSKSVKAVEETKADAPAELPSRVVLPELVFTLDFDLSCVVSELESRAIKTTGHRPLADRLIAARIFQPPRRA